MKIRLEKGQINTIKNAHTLNYKPVKVSECSAEIELSNENVAEILRRVANNLES